MKTQNALALTSILASGLLAGTALAETATDEIIVDGKYLSLDKLNSVKTPTPIIDIPQSLSIIDGAQIAQQAFTNVGDITRYAPGISISQGEGHRDAIIIRGNQTTADFFIDGLRDDVQYFRPLYNVEQIEILRGSNALLFGRGGVGGIVNRVQKHAETGEDFVGYNASVDTFGAHSFAGDVNYGISDRAAFRLNAYYEGLDNHRDFYDGERFGINPTFAFEFNAQTALQLSYEYLDDDRIVDRGVPSVPVTGGPDVPLEGFDKTFFGSPDANLTTLQAHIVRAKLDHTFTELLRGNLTAQFADYDKLYQNLYPAGYDPSTNMVTLDGYRDATQRQNFIIQGNIVGEFLTGAFGHTVLFGAEYGHQDTTNTRIDNEFLSTSDDQADVTLTDPLAIPAFHFDNLPSRDRASTVEFVSVYLQDQIDVTDWLKVVGGVRFDSFDIRVDDFAAGASGARFIRKDERWTPRGGVILKPVENLSAYFSYSETFLPRSGEQFLTLNLDASSTRPQITKTKEVGVKWDVRPDLSVTAALFDLDRESYTSVDPDDPSELLIIEGSQTKGFELQLTGNITEWWNVTTGYSYLDGEVQQIDGGGNNGNKTRQTPENMFSIWNHVQATSKLGFGVGVTYQDSFFVREDNNVEIPSYVRVDAAVYYDVCDQMRVQVNLENLLDEDYFPDAHSNDNISTGEPLNARFTVSGRF